MMDKYIIPFKIINYIYLKCNLIYRISPPLSAMLYIFERDYLRHKSSKG